MRKLMSSGGGAVTASGSPAGQRATSSRYATAVAAVLALALLPVGANTDVDRHLSAGTFTTPERGPLAYATTVGGLPPGQLALVAAGRRMFNETWVLPKEVIGVWGVGPTFNENNCLSCHPANGRAAMPPHGAEVAGGALLRLSVPGVTAQGAPMPHPSYGDQFQNRGVKDLVPAEGRALLHYEEVRRVLPDGEVVTLRRPSVIFAELNFGELGPQTLWSLRVAPALTGLGLLEAVPESALLALRAGQAASGMEGTPNRVWDIEARATVLGRFGWKANQPSLRQQTAAALHGDIGATSELFPAENCLPAQAQCYTGPTATGCNGGHSGCNDANFWEVLPSRLRNTTLYVQALAVPARRNVDSEEFRRGEILFAQARCDVCHVAQLKTGDKTPIASAAGQVIRPYTDLLLHDMGDELADHRPDYLATGRQWRTAPLWALGLQQVVNGHTELLHDGRARGFAEAILWHGGQAAPAREAFMSLSRADRDTLIRFLESI